jgi:hypothetical protein
MKIGILTQPLHNNYGGLLQVFALTSFLNLLGHDPYIINRDFAKPSFFSSNFSLCKRIVKKMLLRKTIELFPFRPTKDQNFTIAKNTSKFVCKYIPHTEKITSTNGLKKVVSRSYDAFIVGSDQVWRPGYSPRITNYYLDFTDNIKVKRLSYAASFGVDRWEYSEELTKKCAALIKKFDAVSVREDSGIELCEKYLGVKALHLLDPTMLLSASDYIQLVESENENISPGTLMTYILDKSDEKENVIKIVAEELNLTPFSTLPKNKLSRKTQHQLKDCIFPTVTSWLRGFIDAEFVITDSFHGCVFSIIFNIPFIVIGNNQRGMARFTSLLKMFHLENRLIYEDYLEKFTNEKIDWIEVNKILESKREISKQFLIDNLA